MVPWGWGEKRKKILSLILYENKEKREAGGQGEFSVSLAARRCF
jgi:hypothetical protein